MTDAIIQVQPRESALNLTDPRMLDTLRRTVALGATDPEFAMFVEFARATGLNPFKRELWFIKAGGRVQMMTGLAGFLAIANKHPAYDGMEVEVDNDDKPMKAVARVYRKDRSKPSVGVALMKEYGKDTPIWRQMPRVMLTKVAKSIALREAFPQELNGMYTDDEMEAAYAMPEPVTVTATASTVPALPEPAELPEVADIRQDVHAALRDYAKEHGHAEAMERMRQVTGATRVSEIPADKLPAMLEALAAKGGAQ